MTAFSIRVNGKNKQVIADLSLDLSVYFYRMDFSSKPGSRTGISISKNLNKGIDDKLMSLYSTIVTALNNNNIEDIQIYSFEEDLLTFIPADVSYYTSVEDDGITISEFLNIDY